MAGAIESGEITLFKYQNKAADRRLIPQSRILRGKETGKGRGRLNTFERLPLTCHMPNSLS